MADDDVLVDVRRLTKYFPIKGGLIIDRKVGEVRAVDDVSFQIYRGETLGLVGESGSGKTTVGRTLLRLEEPTSGEISIEDENFRAMKGEKLRLMRRRLQMIFQDPFASLNPRMKVEALISEPLDIQGELDRSAIRERVFELMDLVSLPRQYRDRYPHEFSGGQRQRIGIARALALNPDLIVCDESIASLDVSIQAQIVNLLKELQSKLGLTYLFIAHDLRMVHHISSRVAVMYLGKLMELASKEEIRDAPLHPYTKALISAIPIPDPEIEQASRHIVLEGDIPNPASPPPGCVFSTRCPLATDVCKQEPPEYREVKPGHFIACHLV
jgi:oligopeptide transport system ATP-binding protein